jgi:polyglycine hydrolase-like protein
MSYTKFGLTNNGNTTHYSFSYDESLGGLGGVEPARTNAVIAACEADYNLMAGWFGGSFVSGMNVQVTTQSNGASWSGSHSSSTIQLKAQGASYSSNSIYLRYLIIAEVVEIFMLAQNKGWFQSGNEGSKGEGLSRFLSGQFLVRNNALGVGIDANYAVADLWLNSPRQDFVNNAPDDNGYDATNGCTTLFIYYLFSQLGYTINDIVGAASSTLAGVYKNLTGDSYDPFPKFKAILDLWFPSQTSSAVPGPNFDDPFPLVPERYTGVWRGGSGPYYLWVDADQSHFIAQWKAQGTQNMRLVDIDVTVVNGQPRFSGVWGPGTDAYYLWVGADTPHFIAKWQELAAQNLRLVSFSHYEGLWAGAWRGGTDGYYLWVDADESHFIAKWQELAAQNLRLVDFDVYKVNGQTLWAGAWRQGTDGYYLWVDADWSHFTAKWQELAAQSLRLVAVRSYNGLWAGAWRSGSDPYYLWANVSQANFISKWSQLANQGLRLIDVEVTAIAAGGGVGGNIGGSGVTEGHVGGGSSEMTGRATLSTGSPGQGGGSHAATAADSASAMSRTGGLGYGGGAAGGKVFTVASPPSADVGADALGHGGGTTVASAGPAATGGDDISYRTGEANKITATSTAGSGGGDTGTSTALPASFKSEMTGRG